MDILELMKYRRSIRRYTDRQVSKEDLLKILEAGAYAPNAGGGQRSRIERATLDYRRFLDPFGFLRRSDRHHDFRAEEFSLFRARCLLCR